MPLLQTPADARRRRRQCSATAGASALSSLVGWLSGVGARVFAQVQRPPVGASATELGMILVDREDDKEAKSTFNGRLAGGIKP